MQDNVLVYKPQLTSDSAKNEPACASSVIFLKPEIDRNLLAMNSSIDDTDSILQSLNSQKSGSAHEDSKSAQQSKSKNTNKK